MKRTRKVSTAHCEVYLKQKQGLTIAFTGNTLPYRKQFRKGAKDFIADKIACHQHAALPKLKSRTTSSRNHNQ